MFSKIMMNHQTGLQYCDNFYEDENRITDSVVELLTRE